MMPSRLIPLALVAGAVFAPVPAAAQDPAAGAAVSGGAAPAAFAADLLPTDTVEVVLVDGSSFYGHVLSEADGVLRLELLGGDVLELGTGRIRSLKRLGGRVVDGEVWRPDPNATRLFFAPTARSLERGHGYFSVYEVFMPFLAVGVHDRVTLAGGTPLFFSSGESERLFWFAPKVQVWKGDRMSAAAGVLHFWFAGGEDYASDPAYDDPDHYGVAYGVVTLGDEDAAGTLGLGAFYSGGEMSGDIAVMIGAEKRGSKSIKFITENYLFPSDKLFLLSAGPRFFGENLTADLGAMVPFSLEDSEGLMVLPIVNFVYNW